MTEAEVMTKEATPKKVMALASRKYSRDDKIKKDEEELEQLIAENKGEVKEEAEEQEPYGSWLDGKWLGWLPYGSRRTESYSS